MVRVNVDDGVHDVAVCVLHLSEEMERERDGEDRRNRIKMQVREEVMMAKVKAKWSESRRMRRQELMSVSFFFSSQSVTCPVLLDAHGSASGVRVNA